MRKQTTTLCLTCLLILSPNVVLGQQISGNLNCKIKDITISAMEEGKPRTYKGLKQGASIGESMRFAYEFKFANYFTFKRTDKELSHQESIASHAKFKPRDDLMRKTFPDHYFSEKSKVAISGEEISIDGYGGDELSLTRYYKNDWQGLMVTKRMNSVAVYSLDCRNTADPLEKILRHLKRKKY